jgi:hypothetical protein
MSTPDFFRSRLDAMIDLRHSLAVLAMRMPWMSIEAALGPVFERRAREGQVSEGIDLFGVAPVLAGGGPSAAGRPRLPVRLMVGLLYLKHAYNESDETVCDRWAQDVYFQFFCGEEYFQPRLPCDPSNLVRFRQALGEAGVEELLATTIAAAVQMKTITPAEFERVIVDTTVQEKAIVYPTDSRLLDVARARLVQLAQRAGLNLKQTYEREGKRLRRRAGGYAHAKQFRRLRRVLKRQRTVLGRLLRDIERKLSEAAQERQAQLRVWLERAWRICRQRPKDRNKLYALHAPEVECIGKVRREVANIIVSPAHKAGDETGRSVGRSLPVHALPVTATCEATGTTGWAFGPRPLPRGGDVQVRCCPETAQHLRGQVARKRADSMSRRIERIIRSREPYRTTLPKKIVVQRLQAAQPRAQPSVRVDLPEQYLALLHLQREPAR